MIVGDPSRFAIEAELEERIDGWALGHLRFWLNGNAIGNWQDCVDLRGCVRWLKDFADSELARYEPGLFELPAEVVFWYPFTGLSGSQLTS